MRSGRLRGGREKHSLTPEFELKFSGKANLGGSKAYPDAEVWAATTESLGLSLISCDWSWSDVSVM